MKDKFKKIRDESYLHRLELKKRNIKEKNIEEINKYFPTTRRSDEVCFYRKDEVLKRIIKINFKKNFLAKLSKRIKRSVY